MEEEKTSNLTPDNTDQGLVRFPRDALPAYYSVKIDCFSRLVDLKIEKYESSTLHAGGFNWRLVLYPNGNTKEGGEGHISLYLAMDKTDTLLLGWEVDVTFKMLVLNHRKNAHLTIPEALKMIENPEKVFYEWEVNMYSIFSEKQLRSEEFTGGKHKWRLSWDWKWFSIVELTTHVSSRWGCPELPLKDYTMSIDDSIVVQAKVNIKAEVTNLSYKLSKHT